MEAILFPDFFKKEILVISYQLLGPSLRMVAHYASILLSGCTHEINLCLCLYTCDFRVVDINLTVDFFSPQKTDSGKAQVCYVLKH